MTASEDRRSPATAFYNGYHTKHGRQSNGQGTSARATGATGAAAAANPDVASPATHPSTKNNNKTSAAPTKIKPAAAAAENGGKLSHYSNRICHRNHWQRQRRQSAPEEQCFYPSRWQETTTNPADTIKNKIQWRPRPLQPSEPRPERGRGNNASGNSSEPYHHPTAAQDGHHATATAGEATEAMPQLSPPRPLSEHRQQARERERREREQQPLLDTRQRPGRPTSNSNAGGDAAVSITAKTMQRGRGPSTQKFPK